MAFIDVVDVCSQEPDDDLVRGWSIDLPRPGYRIEGNRLEIAGWVLGKDVPAEAIECTMGGEVVRRSRLNAHRPDLGEGFSTVPGAEKGGFRVELAMPRAAAVDVEVHALLRDGSRLRVGRLSLRRTWRTSRDPALRDLVSVVIPCYQQAHFLSEAIESVLAQTHPNVEVVVVDDGSTDNTTAVARRYPGVRCIRQDNQGLARARNTGLRESDDDYVVFLDADDLLLPEALATGVEMMEDLPQCAFVFGHSACLMEDRSPPPDLYTPTFGTDPYRALLAGRTIASPSSVMFRRAVFPAVGVFDRTMFPAEDYDLYCRVARHYPVHGHGAVVSSYRQHSSSLSKNQRTMLRAVLAVVRRQRRFVLGTPSYWPAYRAGLRAWKRYYGDAIAVQVQRDVQERRWRPAARGFVALVRWWPSRARAILRSGGRTPPAT